MREYLKERKINSWILREIDKPELSADKKWRDYKKWGSEYPEIFELVRFGDWRKILRSDGKYDEVYQCATLNIPVEEWEELKRKKLEKVIFKENRVLVKSTGREIAKWDQGWLQIRDIYLKDIDGMTVQELRDTLEAYLEFLLLFCRSWRSLLVGPLRKLGRIQKLLRGIYQLLYL